MSGQVVRAGLDNSGCRSEDAILRFLKCCRLEEGGFIDPIESCCVCGRIEGLLGVGWKEIGMHAKS